MAAAQTDSYPPGATDKERYNSGERRTPLAGWSRHADPSATGGASASQRSLSVAPVVGAGGAVNRFSKTSDCGMEPTNADPSTTDVASASQRSLSVAPVVGVGGAVNRFSKSPDCGMEPTPGDPSTNRCRFSIPALLVSRACGLCWWGGESFLEVAAVVDSASAPARESAVLWLHRRAQFPPRLRLREGAKKGSATCVRETPCFAHPGGNWL